MRRKRNHPNTRVATEGYIKRYFGDDIGRILVPTLRSMQTTEIPYVQNPEPEQVLSSCLVKDPLLDKILVFTGLTGSGKTTTLRHVFGLEKNASNPCFVGQTVVIPVDFNRSQRSPQDGILGSLRVAVNKICNTYQLDYPDLENESFYKYIEQKRADFLSLNPKHGQRTSHKERMNTFVETMPTTFASCQLQYVMDHPENRLELVVLVVDNIEAFLAQKATGSQARYLGPVIEAFKLADCIGQRDTPTKWRFNMLIACRHHIWRIMKGDFSDNTPENALLQSYVATQMPYDLADPVKINDIVRKRDEVFSKQQRDSEKWNTSVKVVNTVLRTMDTNIGDFVQQLELNDIRKTMLKMQEVILHRGLQRISDEEIVAGAFQIDSVDQFDLTRVNIVKTIGLGGQKYYSGENSIIPNLFMNDPDEGLELYPLLTLNYFLIRCNYSEPTWDNPIYVPRFYMAMSSIFQDQYVEFSKFFERSIHFLIQHRLLLRSADQPQDEVPGLSLKEVKTIENVYVSGAAIALWRELGKSSALFQLFLDDIWLDDNLDYFNEDGNDIEHCVKYLWVLYDAEQRIYNAAKNLSNTCSRYYLNDFGTTPICKQLVAGLIASLETIIASGNSRSQSRIRTAKETLQQAKRLSHRISEWERMRLPD